MKYKKKYDPSLHSSDSSAAKHNPLLVSDAYFGSFDQRVFRKIELRSRRRQSVLVALTATAAAVAGIAFWFFAANPTENPPEVAALAVDSATHLTGSYLTDQILADEIIEMAAGMDTLFLADGGLWSDVGLKEIPDESIAEYLFAEGVTATEIAMSGN